MLLGAQKIVRDLEDSQLNIAFGIPGGPLSGIFHSLSVSKKIEVILTQHETSAAFMALGYYLFSQKQTVPIVFATSGPGLTNVVTGLAAAFEECVPLFLLTANVATNIKGKRPAQDSFETGINGLRMLESVVCRTEILLNIKDSDFLIRELLKEAKSKSRPVHLNIPGDVAHQIIENGSETNYAT